MEAWIVEAAGGSTLRGLLEGSGTHVHIAASTSRWGFRWRGLYSASMCITAVVVVAADHCMSSERIEK